MKKIAASLAFIITDIIAIIISFFAAYHFRVDVLHALFPRSFPAFFPVEHFYGFWHILPLFIIVLFYENLYTKRFDFAEELVYIVRGLFIAMATISVFIYFSKTNELFSRTLLLLMFVAGTIIVPLNRLLLKKALSAFGLYLISTVIVGIEDEVLKVRESLDKLQHAGYNLLGLVEVSEKDPRGGAYPFLGTFDRLDQILTLLHVEAVILVSPTFEKKKFNYIVNKSEQLVREVKFVWRSVNLKTIGVETEHIDEIFIMTMKNNLLSPLNRFVKRFFDVSLSLAVILLLLPLMLLVAFIIKLESPGPAFFLQERFGRRGKRFRILKFRTMYENADQKLEAYLQKNPLLGQEWQQYKKLKSFDPRITKTGALLRRFSFDELPQVFNILRGHMSFVGPRPYLIREKEDIEKSASIIFRIKPGLTGLWQTRGRNELSFEKRQKLDEFYVRNWSILLDAVIVVRTFGAVIKGKGAY